MNNCCRTTHILNVLNQMLAYGDGSGITDNPRKRNFDYTRRSFDIAVASPTSETAIIPPLGSLTLFDGTEPTGLVPGTSQVSIALLSPSNSVYQLSATSGSLFRTPRSISGLVATSVTINNNALAVFNFGTASLSSVIVGDIMRIAGAVLYDTPPFAFNPLNAGLWVVVGISVAFGNTLISVIRPIGTAFSGVVETETPMPSDVEFYSGAGIQIGDKIAITSLFSPVSQNVYVVQDATPDTINFVSSAPLPNEGPLTYVLGAITAYISSKRLVAIEVDQSAVIQYNGDTGLTNLVKPIVAGQRDLVGWENKWGDTWSCTVVNRSINPLNISFFTAE